jgi:hypothetical protein
VTDKCIFCFQDSSDSPPEHIISEALGCPEDAVLRNNEVCRRCNHRLGGLDEALVNSLDIPRLLAGQRGKRRRGPSVSGRRNIMASAHGSETTLYINAGPGDVTLPNGRVLKEPDGSSASVVASESVSCGIARIRIKATLLHDRRLARALHKVALEVVALYHGVDAALASSLNSARRYVLTGEGGPRRVYVLLCLNEEYQTQLWAPYSDLVVPIRLAAFEFLVDLKDPQSSLPRLSEAFAVVGANRKWKVIEG